MNTSLFCVGLTGGIGSGKSTVAEIFFGIGAGVIDTDLIAHQLTGADGAAMPEIVDTFGAGFASESGALDRVAMRAHIFSDSVARRRLESILHPLIRTEVIRRLSTVAQPYAMVVVPLLVENLATYRKLLHRIAVVDCDEGQQLIRTAARPGLDIEQAKAILAVQSSRAERLRIADDVIDNRGDLESLEQQVKRLHREYLRQAARISGKT